MGPVDPVVTPGPPLEALADPTWQPGPRAALGHGAARPGAAADDRGARTRAARPRHLDDHPHRRGARSPPRREPVAEPEPAAEALDPGPAVPDPVDATAGRRRGTSGLLRSNLVVASGTAVSRLTGFVRTFLILSCSYEGLSDAYVRPTTRRT